MVILKRCCNPHFTWETGEGKGEQGRSDWKHLLLEGLKILNVSLKESFNLLTFFTIVLRLTYLMAVVTQF